MSIKVNDVVGVAGFAVPKSRVDVVVTMRVGQESMSRLVVSNIQVLASGTKIDQEKSASGEAMPTSVVTLLVTPQDAERIALAQNDGQIMLALRNPLDIEPSADRPAFGMSSLMALTESGAGAPGRPGPAAHGGAAATAGAPARTPLRRFAVRKRTEEVVR